MRTTHKIKGRHRLEDLVRLFAGRPGFFLLDSSRAGDPQSNVSYLAFDPADLLEIRDLKGPSLDLLNAFYRKHRKADCTDGLREGGFRSGFLLFLSYDLGLTFLGVKSRFLGKSVLPHAFLGYYPVVISLDDRNGLGEIHYDEGYEERFRSVLEEMEGSMKAGKPKKEVPAAASFRLMEQEEYPAYAEKIRRIREYIYEGDVYQINYTRQFAGHIDGLDPTALYLKLRKENPAPFSAYVRQEGWAILSSSPERLVRGWDGRLETRPIKGTIGVSRNPFLDRRNRKRLLASEKDRSELLMIVDLERNDLARCSESGSVRVDQLYQLETYETVHHLVATISSRMKEGATPFDVLSRIFPGGSITGTPKRRAAEIIDELEEHPRGIYTGSIGYLDHNGNFDLNIAIRTIVAEGETVRFNVGGGITWKSEAESEFRETEFKALGMERGLGIGR